MTLAKSFTLAAAIVAMQATAALADEAPKFFKDTYPSNALDAAMNWYMTLQNENAALDAKTRELIGLGVAAQIPCAYCVYAHTQAAKAAGATDEEIREAVATAGATRNWSTVLNGMAYNLDEFKAEYDKLFPSN